MTPTEQPLAERIAALRAQAAAKRGDPLCTACAHRLSKHEGMLCVACVEAQLRHEYTADPIHDFTRAGLHVKPKPPRQHAEPAPPLPKPKPKPDFQWGKVEHLCSSPCAAPQGSELGKYVNVERVTNTQGESFLRLRSDANSSITFTKLQAFALLGHLREVLLRP